MYSQINLLIADNDFFNRFLSFFMKNGRFFSRYDNKIQNNPKKRALFIIKNIIKSYDKTHLLEIFLFNMLISLLHPQGLQTHHSMNMDLEKI